MTDNKKRNTDNLNLQAFHEKNVETADDWANQAEITGNAADGLSALYFCLVNKVELPENLRQWVMQAIELSFRSDGKITLDQAFGVTDSTGQRNAYRSLNYRRRDYALAKQIALIKHITNFKVARICRLIHAATGDSIGMTAQSMRVMFINSGMYDLSREFEADSSVQETAREMKGDVMQLKVYDVAALAPKDRDALRLKIKELQGKFETYCKEHGINEIGEICNVHPVNWFI